MPLMFVHYNEITGKQQLTPCTCQIYYSFVNSIYIMRMSPYNEINVRKRQLSLLVIIVSYCFQIRHLSKSSKIVTDKFQSSIL